MVDATHKIYNASERSYFSIIKKEIHALAVQKDFSARRIAEIDIIVAELTSNLGKYAQKGSIYSGWQETVTGNYLEIISIDYGPGIPDLPRVIADGYSSSNTLGHGLGSIKRLADYFDIYSQKGWGTIAVCRIYKSPKGHEKAVFPNIKPLVLAKTGEVVSGDGFVSRKGDRYLKIMLADGLGHGIDANIAVNEAATAFAVLPYDSPTEIIRHLHTAIRKTRGMVAMVGVFDLHKKKLSIAGVGNISARLQSSVAGQKNIISYNGIVGHNIPNTMNDNVIDLDQYQELILCSDGIKSRWDTGKYVGLHRCDPIIKATALVKEYSRNTDDTSVVVIKLK